MLLNIGRITGRMKKLMHNWKKWLSIGLTAVVITVAVFTLLPRVEVKATSTYVSLSVGLNTPVEEIDLTPPTLDIKFEPSGTHVDSKGNLKIRLDFYPTPESKCYEKYLVKDGKTQIVAPCLCHFVTISPDITVTDLNNIIASFFTGNVTATIDDAMLREDSAHYISPYMRTKTSTTSIKVAKADEESLVQSVNSRLFGYEQKAGTLKGKAEKIESGSIDVGSGATDRGSTTNITITVFDINNAANASGSIDTAEMWLNTNGTAVELASIYLVSGTKFSTRDTESIGNVAAGSKKTFTGLTTNIVTGDYYCIYGTAGSIERDNSGSGYYWVSGDNIPCTNTTFALTATRTISLYATGTEVASYSLTNAPDSKAFGVVAAGTTYYAKGSAPSNPISDGECTFTITNDSAGAEDIDIKGSNFTGGVGWTLAGSTGENQVKITAYYSGQNPASGIVLTTSDQEFYDGLAGSATIKWDFKMETPTSFTDGVQKTGTITLTAVAED
jgi:hypothetical protein